MMIECCRFGTVVQCIAFSVNQNGLVIDNEENELLLSIFGKKGCFIISFESDKNAHQCAKELHDTTFRNNTLLCACCLHSSTEVESESIPPDSITTESIVAIVKDESTELSADQTAGISLEETIKKAEEDVEDFLNSLL